MINLKTTDTEKKIDKAVKMFIEKILDSKDELNVSRIDLVGVVYSQPYSVDVSFIISKGDKLFSYTYLISIREMKILDPALQERLIMFRAKSAIEEIKERLIKNVK
nr:hypothetical protein [uncultured Haemophilus sp.]